MQTALLLLCGMSQRRPTENGFFHTCASADTCKHQGCLLSLLDYNISNEAEDGLHFERKSLRSASEELQFLYILIHGVIANTQDTKYVCTYALLYMYIFIQEFLSLRDLLNSNVT